MSSNKCKIVLGISAIVIAGFAIFYYKFRSDKMTCIFCDIIAKKTDTELLYEDEVAIFGCQF
jgi:hypothetical protein